MPLDNLPLLGTHQQGQAKPARKRQPALREDLTEPRSKFGCVAQSWHTLLGQLKYQHAQQWR